MTKACMTILAGQLCLIAALAPPAVDAAPRSPDPSEVLRTLANRPELRTVGLLAAQYDASDDLWRMEVVVDRERAAEQLAAIPGQLQPLLGSPVRVDTSHPLALSELLSLLQQQISETPQLEGCSVEEVFLDRRSASSRPLDLVLRGQILQREQLVLLGQIAEAWLEADGSWQAFQDSPLRILFLPGVEQDFAVREEDRLLQERLQGPLVTDPDLHGCWLTLQAAFDRDGQLVRHYAHVWLDGGRAERQREVLAGIVRAWERTEIRWFREDQLPVSELVTRVNRTLTDDFQVPGNWMVGAYFQAVGDHDLELVPYGRLARRDFPPARLVEACNSILDEDPVWQRFQREIPARLTVTDRNLSFTDEERAEFEARVAGQRDAMRRRFREERDLHGAWVEIVPCMNHDREIASYDVHLWWDVEHGDSQRERVESMLENLDADYRIVETSELPLADLVSRLQTATGERFADPGSWISGAYYSQPGEAPDSSIEIVLFGRVFREYAVSDSRVYDVSTQRLRILEMCQALMARDSRWADSRILIQPVDRYLTEHRWSETSRALRQRLRDELRRDPRLHGCWLELVECYAEEGELEGYDVYLWQSDGSYCPRAALRDHRDEIRAHSGSAAAELSEGNGELAGTDGAGSPGSRPRELILSLLDQWSEHPYEVVAESEVPFAALLRNVAQTLREQGGGGVYLGGAYFHQEDRDDVTDSLDSSGLTADVELVLYGQVLESGREQELIAEVNLLLQAPDWQRFPGPGGARVTAVERALQEYAPSEQTVAASTRLRDTIQADVRLSGVWVELLECLDHQQRRSHYQVYLTLDEDGASAVAGRTVAADLHPPTREAGDPSELVSQLLDEVLGSAPYVIAARETRPLSQWVARLQRDLAGFYGPGCHITGAFYTGPGDGRGGPVELVLEGRAADQQQLDVILEHSQRLLDASAAWSSLPGPRPIPLVPVGHGIRDAELSETSRQPLQDIYRALSDHQVLPAVWIDLAECRDRQGRLTHYDVYLQRDHHHPDIDTDTVRAILDQILPVPYVVATDDHFPLVTVRDQINLTIEAQSRLAGCYVAGLTWELIEEAGLPTLTRRLNIVGRIAHESQRAMIQELLETRLNRTRGWRNLAATSELAGEGLRVLPTSSTRAAAFFNSGLDHYRKCRFAEASQDFRMASVEAPFSLEYRYWRIVAEIQRGHSDQAYRSLLATMLRHPTDEEYRRVQVSLNRVQGPPRMALLDLEKRARHEFSRFQQRP